MMAVNYTLFTLRGSFTVGYMELHGNNYTSGFNANCYVRERSNFICMSAISHTLSPLKLIMEFVLLYSTMRINKREHLRGK